LVTMSVTFPCRSHFNGRLSRGRVDGE
jgi:hypothetical protein